MIAVFPPSPVDELAEVLAILERWSSEPGPLLPILHDVQDALGYIPAHLVPNIADALNLSRAEVHGVISYYHHFRTEPVAHVLQICRAESCQAMGSEALVKHARQHPSCATGGTSKDGAFTVESVYCLGLCASSPALMLDGEPHARMTPSRFDALIDQTRSGT